MGIDAADETLLRQGELHIEGQLAAASNATLRCVVERPDGSLLRCVYKPTAGERPLWDFPPSTLAQREVAMYHLSRALGFHDVPTTVWRSDGPYGPGMCQRWIDVDPDASDVAVFAPSALPSGWRGVLRAEDESGNDVVLAHTDLRDVQRIAFLDALANNADRKAGHLLRDVGNRLWAIDHGLTFHVEPKLRTVLWGWAGEMFDDDIVDLRGIDEGVSAALTPWLSEQEVAATLDRLAELQHTKRFPTPTPGWPSIPWPVF